MAEAPTFQIPRDVIEPIIQSHVAAAVVAALGGGTQMVEAAVCRILSQNVDAQGRPTDSSYQAKSWIMHTMQEQLRKAIIEAVAEELPKHKDAIRALISRELKKSNSPLLRQFVEGMAAAVVSPDVLKYRFHVSYETDAERSARR